MLKTVAEAEAVCGPLSKPSKMPCHGYSIPAKHCLIGQKMRNVKGSICSVCYALKGRYVFPKVQDALERRFQSLRDPEWINAIVFLISKKEKSGFFRWHDSGDLQGVWHLEKIVEVAKRLPEIKFWLPTREYNIVREYLYNQAQGQFGFPKNLTVRLSGLMLDGKPPNDRQNPYALPTSGAVTVGYNCLADKQGNKCLDCRLCWNSNIHVNYKKH